MPTNNNARPGFEARIPRPRSQTWHLNNRVSPAYVPSVRVYRSTISELRT